ncbi:sugar phosphate isomerase/epimerase [Candidatus Woesearchaeota archaeon]|nr:sugar phosphate isomerase/epimerase [Candidatus Woesearchaeota archaeon]
MQFNSGYYSHHPVVDYFNAMDPQTYGEKPPYGAELGIKDIGMSVPMGISAANVAGIYSKIRMGAGNIEIQFPGYRMGSRNAQTPEMLGEDQRQAIRELSMANEVKFTTHASFQLMGMMGRDERGNFSIQNATQDMFELKRAIDFQSDMGGGSVVIHSGEFERPITDMYMDDETGRLNLARDRSGRLMFRQAHTQEIEAHFELLDDRTSAKIETVQKNRLVAHPVWNRAEKSRKGVNQDGKEVWIRGKEYDSEGKLIYEGDYIDYEDRLIKDPYNPEKGRVPKFNTTTRQFDVKLKSFEDFRREAEQFNRFEENKLKRKLSYYEKMYPEEAFVRATLDANEGISRGWALQFSAASIKRLEALKKLNEAMDYYKKLEESMPADELWKIMRQDNEIVEYTRGFAAPEIKKPTDLIKKAIFDNERGLDYDRTSASGQLQQAMDTYETKQHIVTPIKRMEKHGVRLYAEAGVHAMQKTRDPNNPVVVAIEHIFPERFGGHPEELKWIIKKSRERMVEMLTQPEIEYGTSIAPSEVTPDVLEKIRRGEYKQPNPYYTGISKEEAERLAEKHLKATIDTGHINLWRKYWQDDIRKTKEENDAAFNKWAVQTIESLAKEKMVGNIHLADNYGYHDDHLAPGQGNSPVREIINTVKKYGYDKAITVEPGADASTDLSDFHGLMKTWKFFGSPVYGMGFRGAGVPQTWADVQYSFFGQNKPPYYIFGAYAPSNDWTLWSAVPLE